MKYFLVVIAILLSSVSLSSQDIYPALIADSSQYKFVKKDPFWKHTITPAIFLGLSIASWEADNNVRTVRNRYTPDFRSSLDNYTQYAPAVSVFALKAIGVDGRNKLGRSVINWGGGMLVMGGLVNGLKYTTKVMRPDGSSKNSFPSGHTATAFMNATFMHKEYGHINPLYSVLGYSMATYTGISRSLNNRHWLSDILAGAGIGILSTELSYLIIDSFYKNKGDFFSPFDVREQMEKPSFISVRIGQSFYLDDFKSFGRLGLEGALEGAYYFNQKWGIGGEVGFMHIPFERNTIDLFEWDDLPPNITNPQMDIQSLGFTTVLVGGYYTKTLSPKLLLQGKVLTGIGTGTGGNIDFMADSNENGIISEIKVPLMEYTAGTSLVVGGGISLTGMVAPTLGMSLYTDYKYANPKAVISISKYYEEIEDKLLGNERLPISSLTFGLKLTSFF